MAKHAESIIDTDRGLEPWQFYGPSTRRGDRIYLHLLMKPYETITVRGVPIKRVKSVWLLGADTILDYSTRCNIMDSVLNPNPLGELTIQVPESTIDPYATVIAVDFELMTYPQTEL